MLPSVQQYLNTTIDEPYNPDRYGNNVPSILGESRSNFTSLQPTHSKQEANVYAYLNISIPEVDFSKKYVSKVPKLNIDQFISTINLISWISTNKTKHIHNYGTSDPPKKGHVQNQLILSLLQLTRFLLRHLAQHLQYSKLLQPRGITNLTSLYIPSNIGTS